MKYFWSGTKENITCDSRRWPKINDKLFEQTIDLRLVLVLDIKIRILGLIVYETIAPDWFEIYSVTINIKK